MQDPFEIPVLDLARMASFEKLIGPVYLSIYAGFFADCAKAIDVIGQAAGDDFESVRRTAHKMKGSAATVGMLQLATLFELAEESAGSRRCRAADWSTEAKFLLARAEAALQELRDES